METADQIPPLVRNEIGIGFIPVEFLTPEEPGIFQIQLQEKTPVRSICMVKKDGETLNAAAHNFESVSLQHKKTVTQNG